MIRKFFKSLTTIWMQKLRIIF